MIKIHENSSYLPANPIYNCTLCVSFQLALTAASPVFRGYLTEVDCRWDVISRSVDCRTRQERGLEPLTTDKFVIPKSRYDSTTLYLSSQGEK